MLVQTNDPSIQIASIVGLSVLPASNPVQPDIPVIPPEFENDAILTEVEKPMTLRLRAKMNFIIPSQLSVTREPYEQVTKCVCVCFYVMFLPDWSLSTRGCYYVRQRWRIGSQPWSIESMDLYCSSRE